MGSDERPLTVGETRFLADVDSCLDELAPYLLFRRDSVCTAWPGPIAAHQCWLDLLLAHVLVRDVGLVIRVRDEFVEMFWASDDGLEPVPSVAPEAVRRELGQIGGPEATTLLREQLSRPIRTEIVHSGDVERPHRVRHLLRSGEEGWLVLSDRKLPRLRWLSGRHETTSFLSSFVGSEYVVSGEEDWIRD